VISATKTRKQKDSTVQIRRLWDASVSSSFL
jgi:hypothetical protein